MAEGKVVCAEIRIRLKCRGRNAEGKPALEKPVNVVVDMVGSNQEALNNIATNIVVCRHNTGGHGHRCKASHPNVNKVGEGVLCPFAFDYPYVTEGNPNWECPEELKSIFDSLKDL